MSYLSKRVSDKMSQESPGEVQSADFRCSWVAGSGERCRYPGTITTDASTGDEESMARREWFCRYHALCTDAQVGDVIVEDSREYRQLTKQEESADFDAYVARWNKEHLNLYQMPGESKHAYAMRCRDKIIELRGAKDIARGLAGTMTAEPKNQRQWALDILEAKRADKPHPKTGHTITAYQYFCAKAALPYWPNEPATALLPEPELETEGMREPGEE